MKTVYLIIRCSYTFKEKYSKIDGVIIYDSIQHWNI